MTVTRIEPKSKLSLFEWREMLEFRDLLYFLALRDIQVRYKQTALGVVWVILQPLVPAVIYAVLFGNFAKLPSDGQPYMLMVLCGLLPWNLFNNVLNKVGGSVVAGGALISKIYFPRTIIPIASIGSVVVDTLVAIAVLAIIVPFFHIQIGLQILAAPLFLAAALISGFGIGLAASALNVYYRDISYVIPFGIQLMYYATPIVYSSALIPPEWRFLYAMNPAVGFIEGFRWSILGGSVFTTEMLITSCLGTVVFLVLGMFIFRKAERGFVDVI